MKRLCRNIGSH